MCPTFNDNQKVVTILRLVGQKGSKYLGTRKSSRAVFTKGNMQRWLGPSQKPSRNGSIYHLFLAEGKIATCTLNKVAFIPYLVSGSE